MKRSIKEYCEFFGVFLSVYGALGLVVNSFVSSNNTLYAVIYLAALNPFLGIYCLATGSLYGLFSLRVPAQNFSLHNSMYTTGTILFWLGPAIFLISGIVLVVLSRR